MTRGKYVFAVAVLMIISASAVQAAHSSPGFLNFPLPMPLTGAMDAATVQSARIAPQRANVEVEYRATETRVIRLNADGTVTRACVHGDEGVHAFFDEQQRMESAQATDH